MRLSSYDTLSKPKQVLSTLMVSVYYLMTGLEEALVESKGEIEILQEKVSSLSVQLLTGKTSSNLQKLPLMVLLTRMRPVQPSPRRTQMTSIKEDTLNPSTLISHNLTGSLK